ncbi:MAG: hypothetical protein IPG58_16470 [Acidobacteria bacterium]|nr:hypothetical protein [Acidobacteriota bacterium]
MPDLTISPVVIGDTSNFAVTSNNNTYTINAAPQTASITNSPQVFDNTAKTATVVCSQGGAVGDVRYNGSPTLPITANTYSVTAGCGAVPNCAAGDDLAAGNFVIVAATGDHLWCYGSMDVLLDEV